VRRAVLALAIALAACAVTAKANPLAGTAWQLAELRSPDDAIGIVRPRDPGHYTLAFDAEGNVAVRLDCNRGRSRATVTAERADQGRLEFGPIAATRAMCPPGSLDARLARELPFVRRYVLQPDGKLRLELFADGGQQVWERLRE
jgi:para-nitrobenzyl esterase